MMSRLSFTVSLLVITTLLSDESPATAQTGTFSLPPAVQLRPRPVNSREPVPAKPIVVAELVEKLRTANVNERQEIIRQLSDTRQNIVPELVKALDDPEDRKS